MSGGTDILDLYGSRIREFICSFWNAFSCPGTIDCVTWLEVGKGQRVQAELQTCCLFFRAPPPPTPPPEEVLRGLKSFS